MQDFTTFTDIDAPGRLTQIAARSTFMGLRGNDADVYLYKSIVGALSTNFSQEFEFYIDAADPTEGDHSAALVSYVQDLDDWEANRAGNKNQISVMVDNVAAGPAPRVALVETNGGTVYTSPATYNPSMDTLYYCTFIKVGTTATLYIYSDAARTTLVATLTLTLQAGWGITFVMAPQSNGSGDTDEISGYIQDMDDPQSYEDLLCKLVIRNASASDLPSRFEAQAIAELLAKIAITHSIELLAKFKAQATAELQGTFEVGQGSTELLGKAVIRHVGTPAELLGKAEVGQGSAELLGKFEAQATADLLGKVVITHSIDLPCKFRTSIPNDWIVQGVSVEAYIALTIVI